MTLSGSVGKDGVNKKSDVETIQRALNAVPADQGAPSPELKVDGICGPKTRAAIQKFQLHHFGWSLADSRVDPDGPTMRKLDELTVPGNPQYDAIIRAINDVMQSAAKMPLNPGSAVRYGFLTPEVQAKLVSLQSLLAAYSGPGIQKA